MAHAFCTPSTTHTESAIIWSPPLGLSHTSTTTVATAVILTLATYMSGKSVSSPHTNMTVYCWRTSPRQQCSAANWKLTCSKLHSTCNMFKWCYGCENLKQIAMWQTKCLRHSHLQSAKPLSITNFSTCTVILACSDLWLQTMRTSYRH